MRWVRVCSAIVAFEYLAALLIGYSVGFHYEIPVKDLGMAGLGVAIIGSLIYCMGRVVLFLFQGEKDPLPRLWSDAKGATDFPIVVGLVAAQMAVLAWVKVTLPKAAGFWADPMLADWDVLIFGTDPWRYTHMMPGWFDQLIDRSYVTWAFASFGVLIALAFARPGYRKSRALISYFLVVCLVSFSQYLLPSAGPVFYEAVGHGNRFADLPIQPWVQATADYLWINYEVSGGKVGGGISAMPSLHVGGVAWMAIVARSYFPRFQFIAWAYLALIFVGSVHLGWHYAVDGIAGLGLALLAWHLAARLLILPVKRSGPAPASEPAPALD